MGGSGLGDAIVAWAQGTGANTQIATAVIDAPPDPFLVLLPSGWQRKRRIQIAWDRTLNAIGGVRYSVSIDDEPVVENLERLRARLTRDDVEDGRHRVQIFATDEAGQETGSRVGRLLVDRRGPQVRLRRRGLRLTVVVSDGAKRAGSGLRRRSVEVSFGDGRPARGARTARSRGSRSKSSRKGTSVVRVRQAFEHAGSYRLRVSARDRAGNQALVKRTVKVG
jgi:hypothetical protein